MLGGGDRITEGRVHNDDALGGSGPDIDVIDADAGPTDNFEIAGSGDDLLGHFGGRANRQPVITANDFFQLFFGETNPDIGVDATLFENGDGGSRQLIGNQHTRHVQTFLLVLARLARPSADPCVRLPRSAGSSPPGPGQPTGKPVPPTLTPPWPVRAWLRRKPIPATASAPRRRSFPPSSRTRSAGAAVRRDGRPHRGPPFPPQASPPCS